MQTETIKQTSIFGVLGGISLAGLGFIAGFQANPVVNSLEVRDLTNELALTEGELSKRDSEIETKDELSQQYCTEYKKVKK